MFDVNKDPLGHAVTEYYKTGTASDLVVKATNFDDDIMPLDYLFRAYSAMPPLEQKALELCTGSVLDIGAGAGCHALYLQEKGVDVSALEVSTLCADVLKKRGLRKVFNKDINEFNQQQYNTLLLLMNGIGLAGTIANLTPFLKRLKLLLKPGGQILLDSSDIIYLFENEDGSIDVDLNSAYYGEMEFQFTYKKYESEWFPWLYVAPDMLKICAEEAGYSFELIAEGEHYDYLAALRI